MDPQRLAMMQQIARQQQHLSMQLQQLGIPNVPGLPMMPAAVVPPPAGTPGGPPVGPPPTGPPVQPPAGLPVGPPAAGPSIPPGQATLVPPRGPSPPPAAPAALSNLLPVEPDEKVGPLKHACSMTSPTNDNLQVEVYFRWRLRPAPADVPKTKLDPKPKLVPKEPAGPPPHRIPAGRDDHGCGRDRLEEAAHDDEDDDEEVVPETAPKSAPRAKSMPRTADQAGKSTAKRRPDFQIIGRMDSVISRQGIVGFRV